MSRQKTKLSTLEKAALAGLITGFAAVALRTLRLAGIGLFLGGKAACKTCETLRKKEEADPPEQ